MSDERKENEQPVQQVQFANSSCIAVTGIIGGVVLALGFPWMILAYGQALGPKLTVTFVIAGLVVGGLVTLTSAFFGLVMPRSVGGWHGHCRDLSSLIDEADWTEPDWANWSPRDWKAWGEKLKTKWKQKAGL